MKTFSLGLFLLFIVASAAIARPFTVEDMQKLSRVGNLQLSPDGRLIAFTVARADVEKNAMVTNLWLVPAAAGSPRQLTFGSKGASTAPQWSPDSAQLYFLSNRAEGMQIFRLPLDGGEAKQITSFKTGVNSFLISPDGKTIAFAATVVPDCNDMKCNEQKLKQDEEKVVKAKRMTTLPIRRWDSWVDNKRSHIFVMPAEGGEAVDLTPGDFDSPIWTQGSVEYAFSPDGKEICFSRYTENEALNGNSDLFTVPVTGGTPKQITRRPELDSTPVYSPDGKWIAYSGSMNPGTYSDLTRIFLFNRKTGETKNLTANLDRSVDSVRWSHNSKNLYITYEDQGNKTVARMDIATSTIQKLITDGSSGDVQTPPDDSFVIVSKNDISHPSEIFKLSGAGATPVTLTALTDFNSSLLKEIDFGSYSSFTFDGWNNEKIQCWQVKPPGFDPQKKYPLLLLMHGGPESSWLNSFHYRWNAQLFVARGYVVIMPNFHGSSGFGFAFMDSIKGRWHTAPYEDQMKAVDVALTWPYIDRTRVSALGGSYGGYMANWIQGHTDRFRSLVSHAGLFDVLGFAYSTDLPGWMPNETKSTIWENMQPLIDQSPMTYAKNFKTPMLVIHGEKDFRVDPSQGYAMFQILQARNVPSEFLYFPDENHWILKPANSILWYNSVLDWIDRWSKPDQQQYERMLKAS